MATVPDELKKKVERHRVLTARLATMKPGTADYNHTRDAIRALEPDVALYGNQVALSTGLPNSASYPGGAAGQFLPSGSPAPRTPSDIALGDRVALQTGLQNSNSYPGGAAAQFLGIGVVKPKYQSPGTAQNANTSPPATTPATAPRSRVTGPRNARRPAVAPVAAPTPYQAPNLLPQPETADSVAGLKVPNDVAKPAAAPAATQTPSADVPVTVRENAGNGQSGNGNDWLSTGIDVGRSLLAAIGASKPLPRYQTPPELLLYQNRLRQQSYQGLSPQENALAQSGIEDGYNNTLEAIRQGTAGGGSGGAYLSAVSGAGSVMQRGRMELAAANQAQQRSNMAQYGQSLGTTLSIDQQNFARDYNSAANLQNTYANAFNQGLQDLADRPYENQQDAALQAYLDDITNQTRRTQMARQAFNRRP